MGYGISIYAILLLSVAILFFPAQEGYGFFTLSSELTEKELVELNKSNQIILAEQTRDEHFVLIEKQNPYLKTPANVPEIIKNNDEKSINSLDRSDENFQLIQDEQMSIAEKKCKEILGGKAILNPLFDEPVTKKPTHQFVMDDQIGHMDRSSDEYKDYRLLQISIAEDFRDNNWKKSMSENHLSNPYLNDKFAILSSSVEEPKILEQKLPYRQTEKFQNAMMEQIAFAEKYRNQILDARILGNPYLDEEFSEILTQNIDESIEPSSGISNKNILAVSWSDPTYVPGELEINTIDRESKGFETILALEIEIAQNTINEMGLQENSEEINNEIISLTNENKNNDVERGDQGFEFFKNKEIDAAEKKLMEILGQKNIHNPDY